MNSFYGDTTLQSSSLKHIIVDQVLKDNATGNRWAALAFDVVRANALQINEQFLWWHKTAIFLFEKHNPWPSTERECHWKQVECSHCWCCLGKCRLYVTEDLLWWNKTAILQLLSFNSNSRRKNRKWKKIITKKCATGKSVPCILITIWWENETVALYFV